MSSSPPPGGMDDAALDGLRNHLNICLAQKRFDDARETAEKLRDELRARPTLDKRQAKALDGVEALLKRFQNQRVRPVFRDRRSIIVVSSVAGGILILVLALSVYSCSRGNFERDVRTMLGVFDRLDSAVQKGVTLSEYQHLMGRVREVYNPFYARFQDRMGGNVTFRAFGVMYVLHDRALSEWRGAKLPSGVGPTFAMEDKRSFVDWARKWRAAHSVFGLAGCALRKDKAPATRDLSTPQGRLIGHWKGSVNEIYLSPVGALGTGWYVNRVLKTGGLDVGAYEVNRTSGDEVHLIAFIPDLAMMRARVSADDATMLTISNNSASRVDDSTVPVP